MRSAPFQEIQQARGIIRRHGVSDRGAPGKAGIRPVLDGGNHPARRRHRLAGQTERKHRPAKDKRRNQKKDHEPRIWKRVLEELPPEELAGALGTIGTILGMGKDALARSYVSLASRKEAPSLDLRAVFKGTVGA